MAPEEFNPINYLCLTPGPITEDMMFVIVMPEGLSTTEYEYIEYSKDNGTSWTRTNNVDDTYVYAPILIDDETPILLRGGGVLTYVRVNSVAIVEAHVQFEYHTKDWYDRYWGAPKLTAEREITETIAASGSANSLLYGEYHNSATAVASNAFRLLFEGCKWLTTAPELPATTLASDCYNGMFYGCTSLTTAPELPATTLVSNCYKEMFHSCSQLNYIKAMFTTSPSNSYTNAWVKGVNATGIFVKNAAATWSRTGVNAIPTGWTIQTANS